MELGEKVNAGSDREADAMPLDGVEWPSVNVHGLWQPRMTPNPEAISNSTLDRPTRSPVEPNRGLPTDLGPCLYLGPSGQRCDRRATKDGFCRRHQPRTSTIAAPFFTPKKFAAFLIALAMLWPELTRFVSALARLLR
jgi:hypothetical protein